MTKPRFNPDLLTVPLYVAGRSIQEIHEKYGLEKIVKLASMKAQWVRLRLRFKPHG